MSVAQSRPPDPPPGPGRAGRGDVPRRRALPALLEGDDLLFDRAADDLPAGLRARVRFAAAQRRATCATCEYVATGVVATAVLFSSAFPGMFNTFIRWQFQRTYDALLAAPVDVEELVTAEILWISFRAGIYGLAPLVVGIAFGLPPSVGMLLVPLIGFVTGFGFAGFGVLIAAVAKTIDNFNYVTSAVLTPMFLVAGTFFPISTLPPVLRTIALFNPLYHCVEAGARCLARDRRGPATSISAGVLIAFAFIMWRLSIWRLESRLID